MKAKPKKPKRDLHKLPLQQVEPEKLKTKGLGSNSLALGEWMCPLCKKITRLSESDDHYVLEHYDDYRNLKARFGEEKEMETQAFQIYRDDLIKRKHSEAAGLQMDGKRNYLVNCVVCLCKVRNDRLALHMRKIHPRGIEMQLLGIEALVALDKGQRILTSASERCKSCGKKIAFLFVGNKDYKAFDVKGGRQISGVHICEPKDQIGSIHFVSAGIVDSNRKRH